MTNPQDPWDTDCEIPPEHRGRLWLVPNRHGGIGAVHFSHVEAGSVPAHAREYVLASIAKAENDKVLAIIGKALELAEAERTLRVAKEREIEMILSSFAKAIR